MHDEPSDSTRFGESFLWTALFRRDTTGRGPAEEARPSHL
jgi:hypothetical protein